MEMIKYTQLGVYEVLVKNDKVLLIKKARCFIIRCEL